MWLCLIMLMCAIYKLQLFSVQECRENIWETDQEGGQQEVYSSIYLYSNVHHVFSQKLYFIPSTISLINTYRVGGFAVAEVTVFTQV